MGRDTFVFYKDWMKAIQGLPDDIRLDIYESVIEYATTGNIRGLKPMASIAFNFIKTTIDRDTEKYVSMAERNKENGKRGGRPRNPQEPRKPSGFSGNPQEPRKADNVSVSVSDNDNEEKERLSDDNPKKKFVRPTLGQVADYCKGRNNGIDPQKFIDHYTANGWMRGKSPIKDWQATVRTWEKPEEQSNQKSTNRWGLAQ